MSSIALVNLNRGVKWIEGISTLAGPSTRRKLFLLPMSPVRMQARNGVAIVTKILLIPPLKLPC